MFDLLEVWGTVLTAADVLRLKIRFSRYGSRWETMADTRKAASRGAADVLQVKHPDKIPFVHNGGGGQGVSAQRISVWGTALTAPFPYYGSKRRLAGQIWERLGNPVVYVEPCAGSIAALLARPGGAGPREIVCDTDGLLCNAWRGLQFDAEGVAAHADYPTIHQDLTARHKYLKQWKVENAQRLSEDPYYYDPEMAGWWLWGMSLWIGGGFGYVDSEQIPLVSDKGGGSGVAAQRINMPKHPDTRPHDSHKGGGDGVSAQRLNGPGRDQIPHVEGRVGGQGISAQRTTRPDLLQWFGALQERLQAVVVLNRSWESALTPTLLQQTASGPESSVGILLDPPYTTVDRSSALYHSDTDGESDDVAAQTWAWALENGDRFRIAYCCHQGDIPVPDGWDSITGTLGGIKKEERRHRLDMIMFSPACNPKQQPSLFDDAAGSRSR